MSAGPPTHRTPARHRDALTALELTVARLRDRLEAIVERQGVGFQQYQVLRLLDGAGEAGMPTLTIARRLVERAPGVTRLADRLEGRALISRARGKDRRQVICRITAEGRKLLASLDQQIDPILESAFAALTHHEIPALVHLLNRIRNRLA